MFRVKWEMFRCIHYSKKIVSLNKFPHFLFFVLFKYCNYSHTVNIYLLFHSAMTKYKAMYNEKSTNMLAIYTMASTEKMRFEK